MITKKKFFGGVALVVVLCLLFGGILPWLMSAKSTIAVGIAFCIVLAIVLVPVYLFMFKNEKEMKND